MSKFIPLSIPNFEGNEKKYVDDALEQGWVSTGGAYISKLEKQMAEFLHTDNVAACQSGTSALHLSLVEAGVKPGDVVIVPPLTFIAAVNPVKYQFATPVFIDCDDSFCMDPIKLRQFCEEECVFENGVLKYNSQTVKALVVVHVFGNMADMVSIMETAHKYNLKVIEDATEALGSYFTEGKYNGKYLGTIGDFGAFSFNGNKIITTSGGGMLLTDDLSAADKARKWSTQARDNAPWYQHSELGYNYRLSNILAGIGRGQLLHLKEHIERKKEIYERYKKGLKGLPVRLNPYLKCSEPIFWLSCLEILPEGMCEQTRSDFEYSYKKEKGKSCPEMIREELLKYNVESRPIWKPMHLQPIYQGYDYIKAGDKDVCGDIFDRGLCLPSDIKMSNKEQDIIIEIIKGCFR